MNTLGAPAVAKQTKPINIDSLQVQVEPVVPTHQRKQNNSDYVGHVARLIPQAHYIVLPDFHGRNTARGTLFYLVLGCT